MDTPDPRPLRLAPRDGDVMPKRGCGPSCGCGPTRGDVRDDEGPSAEDLERFSHATKKCPACRKEVFDDTEVCYHCGEAFEAPEKYAPNDKRTLVVLALIAALVFGLVRFAGLW